MKNVYCLDNIKNDQLLNILIFSIGIYAAVTCGMALLVSIVVKASISWGFWFIFVRLLQLWIIAALLIIAMLRSLALYILYTVGEDSIAIITKICRNKIWSDYSETELQNDIRLEETVRKENVRKLNKTIRNRNNIDGIEFVFEKNGKKVIRHQYIWRLAPSNLLETQLNGQVNIRKSKIGTEIAFIKIMKNRTIA